MPAHSNVFETIYTELDAILDTRLGTLSKISDDAALAVLYSGTYHTREDDKFKDIDPEQYAELYKNRDVETLKRSYVTDALAMIGRLADVLSEQASARPYHDGCAIVVNTYPYKLDPAELEEFRNVISVWMKNRASVRMICASPEELNPFHCKHNYTIMVVYEYQQWMEIHSEAFKTVRLPEVVMMAPAIYFNKTPTKEELEETIKEAAHPMHALELLASPFVELKLINVSHFSVAS